MDAVIKLFEWCVLVTASSIMIGYLCRLNMMQYKKHRTADIGFHVAMFAGLATVISHAWRGNLSSIDFAMMAAALLHLINTYPTWRGSPPEHVRKPPPTHCSFSLPPESRISCVHPWATVASSSGESIV